MEGLVYVAARRPTRDEAFAQAVAEHYPSLVRRLTTVVGDRESALDLAQDAYLRAWRAWDRFDGNDSRAWLYTIGLRLAFNERARRRRWADLLSRRPAAPTWVAPDDVGLHEALAGIRREERAALLLTVVDGYTQADVAGILGAPAGTVASWVSRAKAHLRGVLTDA